MENNLVLKKVFVVPSIEGGLSLSLNNKLSTLKYSSNEQSKTLETDDCRKKRCSDRYDSSESSDSGVATLSCTDSSTASSDSSDPGSPYSPSLCEDASNTVSHGLVSTSTPVTTNSISTSAALCPYGSITAVVSPQNKMHIWPWNQRNTKQTNMIINKKIKRPTAVVNTDIVLQSKKNRSAESKISSKKDEGDIDSTLPQTKITGYFKLQVKPSNTFKKTLPRLNPAMHTSTTEQLKTSPAISTTSPMKSSGLEKYFNIRQSSPTVKIENRDNRFSSKKLEKKTAKVAPIYRKQNITPIQEPIIIAPDKLNGPLKTSCTQPSQINHTQSAVVLAAIRFPPTIDILTPTSSTLTNELSPIYQIAMPNYMKNKIFSRKADPLISQQSTIAQTQLQPNQIYLNSGFMALPELDSNMSQQQTCPPYTTTTCVTSQGTILGSNIIDTPNMKLHFQHNLLLRQMSPTAPKISNDEKQTETNVIPNAIPNTSLLNHTSHIPMENSIEFPIASKSFFNTSTINSNSIYKETNINRNGSIETSTSSLFISLQEFPHLNNEELSKLLPQKMISNENCKLSNELPTPLRIDTSSIPKSLVLESIQQKASIALSPTFSQNSKIQLISDEDFETKHVTESAKSPILQQPKTIRFPLNNSDIVRIGTKVIRKSSDGRIVGMCCWDNCNARYESNSKLLDHLQSQHVNIQTGPFACFWSGCKVYSKESCSKQWLERHVPIVHGGTKPYKCIFGGCGLRFGSHLALQKHVNNHFNSSESSINSIKKSSDLPVPKLLRKNGKKLRYRRQPWSARMFDFFDSGVMEGLQHRLQVTGAIASGPNGTITFRGKQLAKRITAFGHTEILVKWMPCDILPNEWITETTDATKTITIHAMTIQERQSLLRFLKKAYKQNLLNDKNSESILRMLTLSVSFSDISSSSISSNSLTSSLSSLLSISSTAKRYRKPRKAGFS